MNKPPPLTDEEKIAIITRLASPVVMEELLFRRDGIEREEPEPGDEPYGLLDAFDDLSDQADGNESFDKKTKANLREIEIALGWWVVVTEDELSRTVVSKGSKPYAFIRNGLKYKFNQR